MTVSIQNGFHSMTISKKRSSAIELNNQILVLFLNKIDVNDINIQVSNNPNKADDYTNIQFDKSLSMLEICDPYIDFSIKETSNVKNIHINFWIIEKDLCGDVLYSISTKYQMGFEFTIHNLTSNTCFIPQTYSKLAESQFNLNRASSQASINFFDKNYEITKTYNGDTKVITYSSKDNYIIMFRDKVHSSFSAFYSLSLDPCYSNSFDCGIDTIQKVVNGNIIDTHSSIIIENSFCKNHYEKWVHILLISLNLFLFGALFLILLNHFGIIRCKSLLGFPRKAFHFRKFGRSIEIENDPDMFGTIEIEEASDLNPM